jgi:hypothetical protein
MSAGAVFKLIANDGKADRMIMATKLLNQRIKDVMCARKLAHKSDITPTLVDLERTHILFVNAHFKPFAAIGYEYNKVRSQSGSPTLGSTVRFSIPQFGDFFHDMVARVSLSSFTGGALLAPLTTARPIGNFYVDGFESATVVNSDRFYQLVDAFGNLVSTAGPAAVSYTNLVRYCEFPGNRLFSLVKFDVNGNPLDEYNSEVAAMIEKFYVTPAKRVGYNRLVGQENPIYGHSGPKASTISDADTSSSPTTFSALVAATNGTARQQLSYLNGPQTPKSTQPALEIWNKLRFWFNEDARLSIPSVSIPFGQRFITIDLAAQASMAFEFPNLYVKTINDTNAGGIRTISYAPYCPANDGVFPLGGTSTITVSTLELYVNNIFVNPEIHDIFIKRIGFSLIRVYRTHTQRVNQEGTDEKLMSQLKWPVEYIMTGLRPAWNVKSTNPNQWRDWHRMHKTVDATSDKRTISEVSSGLLAVTSTFSTGDVVHDNFAYEFATADTITVTAHGISIFDNFSSTFFNSYMPLHYGGNALVTPNDIGALFINFCLFPRGYQPSGHLNISRAREFYIKWTSTYVGSNTPADLIAVAIALNFLLITDGSAVLRYST